MNPTLSAGGSFDASTLLYDAFPAAESGGNAAGVVLLEGPVGTRWMQGVAEAVGAPTTGLVEVPSAGGEQSARVRFFTPRQEIEACGHVTVAVATALVEAGVWTDGEAVVVAVGGTFPLRLQRDASGGVFVQMHQTLHHLHLPAEPPDLTAILGAAAIADAAAAVVLAGTGLRHLLIQVTSVDDLSRLAIDAQAIGEVSRAQSVDTIGVWALAGQTPDAVAVRMRDLCAGIGATEEPASGTTTGALALALAQRGLVSADRPNLDVTMGIEMGRASRLSATVEFEGLRATGVWVGGRAVRRSTTPVVVNEFGQPVGPALPGWTPRPRPAPELLEGRYCSLVPLADEHLPPLHAALHDGDDGSLWTYLVAAGPYPDAEAMRPWLDPLRADGAAWPMVVLVGGQVQGLACSLRTDRANGSVEVGSIAFGRRLQRTRAATEAMHLMARHVFEDLGYRRYEWKCDALNAPSIAAARRLGFTAEGTFRDAVVYKGRNRDTAWFSITSQEWERLSPAFTTWLDPANFDDGGVQRLRLSALVRP